MSEGTEKDTVKLFHSSGCSKLHVFCIEGFFRYCYDIQSTIDKDTLSWTSTVSVKTVVNNLQAANKLIHNRTMRDAIASMQHEKTRYFRSTTWKLKQTFLTINVIELSPNSFWILLDISIVIQLLDRPSSTEGKTFSMSDDFRQIDSPVDCALACLRLVENKIALITIHYLWLCSIKLNQMCFIITLPPHDESHRITQSNEIFTGEISAICATKGSFCESEKFFYILFPQQLPCFQLVGCYSPMLGEWMEAHKVMFVMLNNKSSLKHHGVEIAASAEHNSSTFTATASPSCGTCKVNNSRKWRNGKKCEKHRKLWNGGET